MSDITWTDDFSVDHFADITYHLLQGTEGLGFTVAPSALVVDGAGIVPEWEDPRAAIPAGFTSAEIWADVVVDDEATYSGVQGWNVVVGFQQSYKAPFGPGWYETAGIGFQVSHFGEYPDSFGPTWTLAGMDVDDSPDDFQVPGIHTADVRRDRIADPSFRVSLALDSGGLAVGRAAGLTLEHVVPPGLMAAWATRRLRPNVLIGGQAPHNAVITAWGYTISAPVILASAGLIAATPGPGGIVPTAAF